MRRHELTDYEWAIIEPLLPNKPRGVPRVNDRRADACACYPTQLGFQFGGVEEMRTALAGLPEVLLADDRAREVLATAAVPAC